MPYRLRVSFTPGTPQAPLSMVASAGSFVNAGQQAQLTGYFNVNTTLPAWVPPLNTVKAINLNTLASVGRPQPLPGDPLQAPLKGVITAWNSGCYSPDYGSLGAYVVAGGGDGDYKGNEVYVYELDTQTWVRKGTPTATIPGSGYTDTFGEYPDGQPAPPHTYGASLYLPPSLGGGPKGSLLWPVSAFYYQQRSSGWAHRFDLDSGIWNRASTNASPSSGGTAFESHWAFDSFRNRYLGMPTSASAALARIYTLDNWSNSRGFHSYTSTETFRPGQDASSDICPELDAWVVYGKDEFNTLGLFAYDLATANYTKYSITLSGDTIPPILAGAGIAWCEDNRKLYLMNPAPLYEQIIYEITPPKTNWRTNAWVVRRIIMSGDTCASVDQAHENGMWQRFRYVSKIGSLVWCTGINNPVYAYRVVGSTGYTAEVTKTALPYPATVFSQSAGSKHSHMAKVGSRWYKMAGDHVQLSLDSPSTQDGRQEIFSWDLSANTATLEQGYYIYDPLQLQLFQPDDAWCHELNGEIWVWRSTGVISPPVPAIAAGSLPQGATAPVAEHRDDVMVWNPTTKRWRVGFAWRTANNVTGGDAGEFRANRAWRSIWDAPRNRWLIPCIQNGLKWQIINVNPTTGVATDGTQRVAGTGVAYTYGSFNCNPAPPVLDPDTGMIWGVDCTTGQIATFNPALGNGYAPLQTNTGKFFSMTPLGTQSNGKLVWHRALKLLILSHENGNFYVYDTINATTHTIPRRDGYYTNNTGRQVLPSDIQYDQVLGQCFTYSAINFAGDGDSTPPPSLWWKINFRRS